MCAKAPTRDSNNRLILCYGRCVTDESDHVRLSKKGHNHPPAEFDDPKQYQEINYRSYIIDDTECDAEN